MFLFSHKCVVSITHEQNIICSKTHIDDTTHEQIIICRQLFAGHVVGSRPMKRKEKMHRMIIGFKQPYSLVSMSEANQSSL